MKFTPYIISGHTLPYEVLAKNPLLIFRYMTAVNLRLQLEAISIFISSSSG